MPRQRQIVDRRNLAAEIALLAKEKEGRQAIVERLTRALDDGRQVVRERLMANPSSGHDTAMALSFLTDQIIRIVHDHVIENVYPVSNPSSAERLVLVAVGGYGRGEMMPHSDVDIAFLAPMRKNSWTEQVIEAILYFLWDLGLKVGHSSRSLDDMVRMAKSDLTIRTSLLEGRYLWGDRMLYEEASQRFAREVVSGTAKAFVSEKLMEREARHKRMGDSRYVVEPNVKEGKGGLRDLQTLYWIGKYVHQVSGAADLVSSGLLSAQEYRTFRRAEGFLLAVRAHLHFLTNRAEDRLTFDLQPEIARRMQFADRPGKKSSVERFMHYYFLQAKHVGTLTAIFLSQLEEQFARRRPSLTGGKLKVLKKLNGFATRRGQLTVPHDDFFAEDPVRMIELFHLADSHGLDIHAEALRLVARDSGLIMAKHRNDPRANAMFIDVLTSPRDPEEMLRTMNEANVFGKFIPDFGRVVAQMQFDMYHHYTVDEHTIRAIGLLSRIEKGELADDHPLASQIIGNLASRRVLYIAVLLHDIAKGRNGDHSVLGAEVAMKLCPRLGLSRAETEQVAWLVRQHLLMSATAFKRDLADFKTVADFISVVQSAERLRMLLILTVVDIRAVGPGTWNSWKRQLLSELYTAAEEALRLGHKQNGRQHRVEAKMAQVARRLEVLPDVLVRKAKTLTEPYWIAEPDDVIVQNLHQMEAAKDEMLSIECVSYPARGATLVTVIAADHPGLFYRIAAGIHVAGGNIIDARIHTLRDGTALDNFLVQDNGGKAMSEPAQIDRIKQSIADSLANKRKLISRLRAKATAHPRATAFEFAPQVFIENEASNRFTVIEVNAMDRAALLNSLARALFESKLIVHSAHITNYGERAVDTFYVTDLLGGKLDSRTRIKALEKRLIQAAEEATEQLEEA